MTIKTKYPKVAVVVVNYNGFEYSNDCITSLLNTDYPDFSILFVDNGSTDGSGKSIKNRYGNKIIHLPLPKNLGVTGGNNAGIDYALQHNYDYILFINNDTIVNESFLLKMVEASIENTRTLVVPKIICYFEQKKLDHFVGSDFNWWTAQPLDYHPYPYDRPELNIKCEVNVASTCCLLVPAVLINDIGRMDENYFMYFDDSDFTIAASRKGYRIIYEPEAKIFHKCNMTSRNKQTSYFEFYLQNRNVFYFYNKLCNRPLVKNIYLTKRIVILLLHLLKSIADGNPEKRKVVSHVIKDIFLKRMGPPPDFSKKAC